MSLISILCQKESEIFAPRLISQTFIIYIMVFSKEMVYIAVNGIEITGMHLQGALVILAVWCLFEVMQFFLANRKQSGMS
jgi:hypothetical protein